MTHRSDAQVGAIAAVASTHSTTRVSAGSGCGACCLAGGGGGTCTGTCRGVAAAIAPLRLGGCAGGIASHGGHIRRAAGLSTTPGEVRCSGQQLCCTIITAASDEDDVLRWS